MIPVRPAIKNWKRNPMQNSIGVLNWMRPPHIVPIQLKILIPVGIPTIIVVIVKKLFPYELIPTVNMWWAQTLVLTKPIATVAATITGYPKIGLREKTGMISEANAKQGITKDESWGMTEIQEEVHPQDGGPPRLRVKEVPAEITIDG